MDKEFLTINDLSAFLSVRRSTLYSLVESGELPHYRIGRLIRFKRGDVDRWMEDHRREGVNADTKARGVLRTINRPGVDIEPIVKKSIAEVKGNRYTPNHGRPDQIRDLRKEVSSDTL